MGQSPSTTGTLTAGYNFDLGRWKNLGVTASWSKTHYQDQGDDTQVYFSLSIPLDPDHRLNYDLRNSDTTRQTLSWYDSSDSNNTWGYPLVPRAKKLMPGRKSAPIISTMPGREI